MKDKTVMLEDAIMVKGLPCTAGTKMLENFTAPFDACVVEKLKNAGFKIGGQCAELKFGVEDVSEKQKPYPDVRAIREKSRYALYNDVWGTVKYQAAHNGFLYLQPSYGRVSRYGLIPCVSSMDQIGIFAQKSEDAFKLLEVIAGYDERDGMSLKDSEYRVADKKRNIKIGKIERLPNAFHLAYDILAAAEFANNISRYDGVTFGYRAGNYKNVNDLYVKSRTEALGFAAKYEAILGNIVLSDGYYEKYYDNAMRIRRLTKNALDEAFKKYDVLEIFPAIGMEYLTLSPLTGHPSLTFSKNRVKAVALAKHMDEDALYAYAREVIG